MVLRAQITTAYAALVETAVYVAGFDGHELSEQERNALGIPVEGLLVQYVVTGSVADEFGLQAGTIPATIGDTSLLLGGDVIVKVNCSFCETSIGNERSIAQTLGKDSSSTLTIIRNGQLMTLTRKITLPTIASLGRTITTSILTRPHPDLSPWYVNPNGYDTNSVSK